MFNTEDLYNIVGDKVLERRGHRFTPELKQKMMGLPGRVAFQVMREECGLSDSVEVLKSESEQIFAEILTNQIRKMPGLDVLLESVEAAGLPKAIATSSQRGFADRALGIFNLAHRFQFILTAEDVEHGKPNPDIYLLACERLGVSPGRALVFEDSLTGSTAAAAAGTYLVAVPTHHSAHLDYSHADLRVGRLDEPRVLNIIRENARQE